jgi:hypothetical protein
VLLTLASRRRGSGRKRSEPGPHLRVWLKEEFVAPIEWGFVARAGQMRNSIYCDKINSHSS